MCVECGMRRAKFCRKNEIARTHCSTCRTDDMINADKRMCVSCCLTQASGKYGYLCKACRHHLHGNRHPKEEAIGQLFALHDIKVVQHDKMLAADNNSNCSRSRPDYVLQTTTQGVVVTVEVDEHMHLNRDVSCEVRRVLEQWEAVGFCTLHMVRYNPDCVSLSTRKLHAELLRVVVDLQQKCAQIDDGLHVHYIGYTSQRVWQLEQCLVEELHNISKHAAQLAPSAAIQTTLARLCNIP